MTYYKTETYKKRIIEILNELDIKFDIEKLNQMKKLTICRFFNFLSMSKSLSLRRVAENHKDEVKSVWKQLVENKLKMGEKQEAK